MRTFYFALLHQYFKVGQAVTIKMLLAAVTKTVKAITKVNDVVVSFPFVTVYQSRNSTSTNTSTVLQLRESKQVIALMRLNSRSDKMFSSNVSMFLGAPVSVKSTIWSDNNHQWKWPEDENISNVVSKYNRISLCYCASNYQFMIVLSVIRNTMLYLTVRYLTRSLHT